MKICLYSYAFAPKVGGTEIASLTLAQAWVELGHDVLLVSDTPAEEGYDQRYPFRVVRLPSNARWKALLAERDVLISNGHSLKHFWQWRRSGIPFGWIHQMMPRAGPGATLRVKLIWKARRWAMRLGHFNICVSEAVRRLVPDPRAVVILNMVPPLFRRLPEEPVSDRFLFYGRMWMPKGLDTLIMAADLCRTRGCPVTVDFYGQGEHLADAVAMAERHGLADLVAFHKPVSGEELVRVVNRARAVVVPSRCGDACPMAIPEALTCGKCIIAARDGGIPESLGDAGITFEPGDVHGLADCLEKVQRNPDLVAECRQKALARAGLFATHVVARKYIEIFESVSKGRKRVD